MRSSNDNRYQPKPPRPVIAFTANRRLDRQYLSIRYTERLAEAGIESSVGSVGSSYDNALAETIIGLFKTEVIRPRGPWKTIDEVEYATCEWVDWYNNQRLLQPIGDIPPAELEQAYYAQQASRAEAA
jgi:transposase InsO family protein